MRTIHDLPQQKSLRRKLRRGSTPQEVILWSRLRRSALGHKFRRQASLGPYIVDFYCPGRKLVIEIDGSQHKTQQTYDQVRSKYLESLGVKVIRFWNNEINANLNGVIFEIKKVLKER